MTSIQECPKCLELAKKVEGPKNKRWVMEFDADEIICNTCSTETDKQHTKPSTNEQDICPICLGNRITFAKNTMNVTIFPKDINKAIKSFNINPKYFKLIDHGGLKVSIDNENNLLAFHCGKYMGAIVGRRNKPCPCGGGDKFENCCGGV